MRTIKQITMTGMLAATLAFAQQANTNGSMPVADQAARAAEAGQPVSNPGFGDQVKNDTATMSGGTPHSNSTYQKDRNGNSGFDPGWIGILGLGGLFGLARKRGRLEEPIGNPTAREMRPVGSRG